MLITFKTIWMEFAAYNLRRLRKQLKLTQEEMADTLGIKRSTYARYEKDITVPNEVLQTWHEVHKTPFAEFSKPIPAGISNISNSIEPKEVVFVRENDMLIMEVPLVSQYAYAGYLAGFGDQEFIDDLPRIPWVVDREHKGNYFSFEVRNDSMYDGSFNSYAEGDRVLGREILPHHWQNKLHIEKWDFIVVHKRDGILLKKIAEHDPTTGKLRLHSLNPMYEDIWVNTDDLAQIFNVVQVWRKK